MNETENPPSSAQDIEIEAVTVTVEPGTKSGSDRGFFKSVSEGFRNACTDAGEAARKAAPKVKSALGNVAYSVSYAAGFGTVFAGTFIKEMLPESVKKGWRDGAAKGQESAENAETPDPVQPAQA